MIYIRTVRDTRLLGGRLQAGMYSYSKHIMIPQGQLYNADLIFEDTGTEVIVRKYRDREPTHEEMMWIVLQSTFVK